MLNLLKRMTIRSQQRQESGGNSTNLQGQQVVVNQGISYSDAKEIANDVFKANFIKLRQEAASIAEARAEEVTDKIISQLCERRPDSIREFQQPALQNALFTVQKEYALSGDKDLGDLLVDILVDRASQPKRNMLQIVLDESLSIAPKLTLEQLDTITLNFLLVSTRRIDIKNYDDLISHFERRILPFAEGLSDSRPDYNHIEYLGCGHIRVGNYGNLEQRLRHVYKGCFSKGFTQQELIDEIGSSHNLENLIIPCFHDKDKLQVGVQDEQILDRLSDENHLSDETKDKLKGFFEATTHRPNEIKSMLLKALPKIKKIFDVWSGMNFNKLELTSVGVAIAHANYRRKTKDTMDLSIWIN